MPNTDIFSDEISKSISNFGTITGFVTKPENMVYGGAGPICSADIEGSVDARLDQLIGKGPAMGEVLGAEHDYVGPTCDHLMADVQPDVDLTRVVVARRMQYVQTNYPSWTEGVARVALGVVLMSTANSIKMQDMVHFLHLAQGSNYLRSHGGQTYFFDNGAFRLFNGVIPESVLQRCSEFASFVEGCLWFIDQKCPSRDELEIYAALDRLFRAATLASSRDVVPGGVLQSSGDDPRGTKRMRQWLSVDVDEVLPTYQQVAEKEIYTALREYALEKCEVVKGGKGSALKSWGAQEAVNCQEMSKKLAAALESAVIIPFYAEYMDFDRTPATGFAMEDVCLAYDPHTAPMRNGRIMKQVTKSASRNIYTYISRALPEKIFEESHARVVKFPGSTFCENAWALPRTIAGLSIALMWENVDRAFWTIGGGGVGQSLSLRRW